MGGSSVGAGIPAFGQRPGLRLGEERGCQLAGGLGDEGWGAVSKRLVSGETRSSLGSWDRFAGWAVDRRAGEQWQRGRSA